MICHLRGEVFGQALTKKQEGYFIYNHVDLVVMYNPTESDESGTAAPARIIRVDVEPRTVDHAVGGRCTLSSIMRLLMSSILTGVGQAGQCLRQRLG